MRKILRATAIAFCLFFVVFLTLGQCNTNQNDYTASLQTVARNREFCFVQKKLAELSKTITSFDWFLKASAQDTPQTSGQETSSQAKGAASSQEQSSEQSSSLAQSSSYLQSSSQGQSEAQSNGSNKNNAQEEPLLPPGTIDLPQQNTQTSSSQPQTEYSAPVTLELNQPMVQFSQSQKIIFLKDECLLKISLSSENQINSASQQTSASSSSQVQSVGQASAQSQSNTSSGEGLPASASQGQNSNSDSSLSSQSQANSIEQPQKSSSQSFETALSQEKSYQLYLSDEDKILDYITAQDERGNEIPCIISDFSSLQQQAVVSWQKDIATITLTPGDYAITVSATHPITKEVYLFTTQITITKDNAEYIQLQQFEFLQKGETYYFDLTSIAGALTEVKDDNSSTFYSSVLGKLNMVSQGQSNNVFSNLAYVPFTYLGNVQAYALPSTINDVTTAQQAEKNLAQRTLFIANHILSYSKWDALKTRGLIYGVEDAKGTAVSNYNFNGMHFKFRAPSGGIAQGESPALAQNEWNVISAMNQDLAPQMDLNTQGYIKNFAQISVPTITQDIQEKNAFYTGRSGTENVAAFSAISNEQEAGYRPVLEFLQTDKAYAKLFVVSVYVNENPVPIKIITTTDEDGNYLAPGAIEQVQEEDLYFTWNTQPDGKGKQYLPQEKVPKEVADLYGIWKNSYEEFNLTVGKTYYFDLSQQYGAIAEGKSDIIGTLNGGQNAYPANQGAPDLTLHYVPFTYAGSIAGYDITNTSDTDTSLTVDRRKSLFICDYNLSHSISWQTLRENGLIYTPKNETILNGVPYKLRVLSGGGIDQAQNRLNEWDSILGMGKEQENTQPMPDIVKNFKGISSFSQDQNKDESIVIRGEISQSYKNIISPSEIQSNIGYRPVLEVGGSYANLTGESLQEVVLYLNGGYLQNSDGDLEDGQRAESKISLIVNAQRYTAPSYIGIQAPAHFKDPAAFRWNTKADGSGTSYLPGWPVPSTVTQLYAQWQTGKQNLVTDITITHQKTQAGLFHAIGQQQALTKQISITYLQDNTYQVDGAYISTNPSPEEAFFKPDALPQENYYPVEISADATTGVKLGQVSLDVQPGIVYYLHSKTSLENVPYHTYRLDTQSPEISKELIQKNTDSDYDLTFHFEDLDAFAQENTNGNQDIAGAASGIRQVAWAVGDSFAGNEVADIAAQQPFMQQSGEQQGLQQVVEFTKETEGKVTLTISSALIKGQTTEIYIYFKDISGNTLKYVVPLSEGIIDVQVPLKVNLVLSTTENKIVSPICYIKNNGLSKVKVEIAKVRIPQEGNDLVFVDKKASFAPNEICLNISPVENGLSVFKQRSIAQDFEKEPLVLASNRYDPSYSYIDPGKHADFTFTADYNHQTSLASANWSNFYIGYRITLIE